MDRTRLVRWAGNAGTLGGLLAVLFPVGTIFLQNPDAYPPGTPDRLASLAYYWFMLVVPYLLMMAGLVALRRSRVTPRGRLGNAAGIVSLMALAAMFVGGAWEMLTFTFRNSESGAGHAVFLSGYLALVVGSALLGWAVLRTFRDPFSRLGALLCLAMLPLGVLLLFALGPVAPATNFAFWSAITIPYGVARVLLGARPSVAVDESSLGEVGAGTRPQAP